jgi:diguanylate cyclase (GGDEF)-like protein/PAS domain S-box-containing protein
MQEMLQATHRLRQSIVRVAAALSAGPDHPAKREIELLLQSARQATAVMDCMTTEPQDVWITCGPEGTVTSVSQGVFATLGYEPEELTKTGGFPALIAADDRPLLRGALETALRGETVPAVTARFHHKNGDTVWLEWTLTPLAEGGVYALGRDVTTHKQYAQLLHESEQLYRALFEYSPDGVLTLDCDGRIITANPACAALSGYTVNELPGKSITDLIIPEEVETTWAVFRSVMAGNARNSETTLRHKDGRLVALHVTSVPLILDDTVVGVYSVVRDITERKLAEEQLAHLAFHDPLTGLANRTLFMNRLDQAVAHNPQNQPAFAILYLDLDDFKIVNDSLGHRAGDALLIETARRLRACVGPKDTVARLGGDEFTVLMDGTADTDDAIRVALRILKELQTPYEIDGHKMVVTPSVGVVMGNQGKDSKELLRYSDIAMYKAKQNGKDRYEAFTPVMYNHVLQRLQLESDLRRAIERNEFRVYYQPIVELQSGTVSGVEALIRWEDPERGMISPGEFIPLAEETGLILPIGRWVLRQACLQAKRWRERFPDLYVSVNLSARQFQEPFLANEVAQVLEETGLSPQGLELEITETVLMQEGTATEDILTQLKSLGILLAMDDFGTGYSSLSYLKRFPIDVLKIDRSFVMGLGESPEDTALVRTVIQLAKALALKVTAEGVETEEQIKQLTAMECDRGQGYFFARPASAKTIEELLSSDRRW